MNSGTATAWSSKSPACSRMPCAKGFKEKANGDIQLFHVAWTFDSTGVLNGHWEENQTNTVSADRKSYAGTYDTKFYDLNDNFLFEDSGTLSATGLPEHY